MYISRLAFVLAALSAASCIDKDVDNTEFYEKYARGFDNRTTVAVNIASEVAGEYYAVYFGNPYVASLSTIESYSQLSFHTDSQPYCNNPFVKYSFQCFLVSAFVKSTKIPVPPHHVPFPGSSFTLS